MSFLISTEAELLKTKRTASFWLSIIGAGLIPVILLLVLTLNPGDAPKSLAAEPWKKLFLMAWQVLSGFLLPMYIILISTLIPQIEIRNNTWKQVFASPQSLGTIYFSKFFTIHLMILFCFVLFNVLMILTGVLANLFNAEYTFLKRSIDMDLMFRTSFKTYISILGISAFQYILALKFKNFIAPVGVGLALVIGAIISINFQWEHVYKYPYAFPILTYDAIAKGRQPLLENHEWNSIGYFVFFMLLGFLDMKLKKEKG